ncbi:MAG: diaminopimelate decarboxylase/aspartate kinase [Enterobacterales bacterium]|jgi:diaminopimelate decarboxylase/aspartate kinase
MSFSVLKFGGSSVANINSWPLIAKLAKQKLAEDKCTVIVLSALANASNLLEVLVEQSTKNTHKPVLEQLESMHLAFADKLSIEVGDIYIKHWQNLVDTCVKVASVGEATPADHAIICGTGELLSTALACQILKQLDVNTHWLDARQLLKLDEKATSGDRKQYLSAICHYQADKNIQSTLLEQVSDGQQQVFVTQGFIASNEQGETILLGRGGSDTSAACIASILEADELEIWTDVPGIFSANPHQVPAARLLTALDYDEAQEIASTGAKVLHPRAIKPVREAGIAIQICSVLQPEIEGTRIDAGRTDTARVKAISMREDLVALTIETSGMWQRSGFLGEVFGIFGRIGISIDLVSTSESNVTVSLDTKANELDRELMQQCLDELSLIARVKVIEPVASISIVGRHIRRVIPRLGPVLESFGEHRIHLISLSSSDLNLTFVVDQEQSARLMSRMHELLVEELGETAPFGPSWQDLISSDAIDIKPVPSWWEDKSEQLINKMVGEDSLYVYNAEIIEQSISDLKSMSAVSNVFFALKANNFPGVLSLIVEAGFGFECVSPGEVLHVLELFPTFDRKRIIFTPNFAAKEEYQFGLEKGVNVTLDNLYPLQHWPEVFKDQEIFVRIDTGHGRGHHAHVKTAGSQSKFGIPLFEVAELDRLVREASASIVGLHAHSGSGIRVSDNWAEVARILSQVASYFPTVKVLDLGGGLGIPEKPGDQALDIEEVNRSLRSFKESYPGFDLWLEPGRYLVSAAGVLLARVNQLKGKGYIRYVGLSTGMNSLIRPALYGAWHPVSNLSRVNDSATIHYQVVGPICETGDRFAADYLLPECFEGDIVAIGNAGAYGSTMSSSYNMREPAIEKMLY